MKKLVTNLKVWLTLSYLVISAANGKMFDSFISYRQGTNAVNIDTAFLPYEDEPDVPKSVD